MSKHTPISDQENNEIDLAKRIQNTVDRHSDHLQSFGYQPPTGSKGPSRS